MTENKSWYVYLLECADGTYYTGITTDLQRREWEHNNDKKAARYTRARRPVKLVWFENQSSRANASKREFEIRNLKREDKRRLANI